MSGAELSWTTILLTHWQIWTAVEALASKNNLSPSGMAKKAGLDPTTFNKSKRLTKSGKPRWPSTSAAGAPSPRGATGK